MSEKHPVLDVRSPGEYLHAHIPNAFSFPLFTDEERKVVGTAYKQEGRQPAIKIGLKYFGPKMLPMVQQAEQIAKDFYKEAITPSPVLLVHCWRGGMRSSAIAWLLNLYGFKVYSLQDGYKNFRNWVLKQFEQPYDFAVVGGYTGSNKTGIIGQLHNQGNAVIDLEQLAQHKGSSFGALGMEEQHSQEMFENKLALALSRLHGRHFFIEDESRRIGKVNVPAVFFEQMRKARVLFIDVPFEERLNFLVKTYGIFDNALLADAIERIQKRLGGLETKNALAFLHEGNINGCFRILLEYYDRWYKKGLNSRLHTSVCTKINCASTDAAGNADIILQKLI